MGLSSRGRRSSLSSWGTGATSTM